MKCHLKRRALLGALMLQGAASAAWAQQPPTTPQVEPDAEAEPEEEAEEIVVQATRSGRRLQDEPIRVEVLNREEIEEKILMRPGSIAVMLSETGGLRVQVTSPSLGGSNIRVQGMDGRYTQLLADGLPLFGGQTSSLGLLQIAPTDLGQVEVIKGAASAFYGPSALGGVIDLVSRRPGEAFVAETLVNATSRDGQDVTAYLATPLGGGFGASITGGLHRQTEHDLDEDGWLDIPAYDRWTVRPRLFWEGADGAKAYLTVGAMSEQRLGGTLPGRTAPDGAPFPQGQDTDRLDAGLVAEAPVGGGWTAQLRGSWTRQEHRHRFGALVERDRHATAFAEASVARRGDGTALVGGIAYQADGYRSATFPAFDYDFGAVGGFVQVEHDLREDLTLAGSARVDAHDEYGTRLSPRLSALYRPGPWTFRASLGGGFYAPTPFVDESEDAGLSRLEPLAGLRAETAETASLDIGYARGPIEANVTLFASNMDDTARLVTVAPDRVRLVNVDGQTRVRGAELLARYRRGEFVITGSYVFVDASEPDPAGAGRREVPLTPRHTGGVVAMWESHGRGRIGLEAYYTGRQALDDNSYRAVGRPYFDLGFLAEIALGRVRLFVNAENILDVRQTDYDPLVRPSRAADGRWTVPAWTATEGRVVNAGVRLQFGGP